MRKGQGAQVLISEKLQQLISEKLQQAGDSKKAQEYGDSFVFSKSLSPSGACNEETAGSYDIKS